MQVGRSVGQPQRSCWQRGGGVLRKGNRRGGVAYTYAGEGAPREGGRMGEGQPGRGCRVLKEGENGNGNREYCVIQTVFAVESL